MDNLTKLAHEAVAKARETHPETGRSGRTGTLVAACKYLRETAQIGLLEARPLIDAAMNQTMGAASLPDGSIVADSNIVFIKNHPTKDSQWRATNGGYCADVVIDDYLRDGATVLRIGI